MTHYADDSYDWDNYYPRYHIYDDVGDIISEVYGSRDDPPVKEVIAEMFSPGEDLEVEDTHEDRIYCIPACAQYLEFQQLKAGEKRQAISFHRQKILAEASAESRKTLKKDRTMLRQLSESNAQQYCYLRGHHKDSEQTRYLFPLRS